LTAGYKQIEQNIKAIQLVNTNESQHLETSIHGGI